jgi:hypothetical protein
MREREGHERGARLPSTPSVSVHGGILLLRTRERVHPSGALRPCEKAILACAPGGLLRQRQVHAGVLAVRGAERRVRELRRLLHETREELRGRLRALGRRVASLVGSGLDEVRRQRLLDERHVLPEPRRVHRRSLLLRRLTTPQGRSRRARSWFFALEPKDAAIVEEIEIEYSARKLLPRRHEAEMTPTSRIRLPSLPSRNRLLLVALLTVAGVACGDSSAKTKNDGGGGGMDAASGAGATGGTTAGGAGSGGSGTGGSMGGSGPGGAAGGTGGAMGGSGGGNAGAGSGGQTGDGGLDAHDGGGADTSPRPDANAACPGARPTSQSSCAAVPQDIACYYGEFICMCYGSAGGSLWACGKPPAGCPTTVPNNGSSCNVAGMSCSYDFRGCATVPTAAVCTEGKWLYSGTPCS